MEKSISKKEKIAFLKEKRTNIHTYAPIIFQIYKKFSSNDIPPTIRHIYTSNFLFGLHKDSNDKTKIRPIAIGGAWRRLFTSTTVKHFNHNFMEFLAPYNYAIGVKGGTSFIYHTVTLEINKTLKNNIKNILKT